MESLISIIIEDRGNKKYLSRCMNSIYRQNYEMMEVICIGHDLNGDAYNEIKNIKRADNLYDAVSLSLGEYLFFVDRNTVLENNSISCLIKSCDNELKKGFFCSATLFDIKNQCKAKLEQYLNSLTGKIVLKEILLKKLFKKDIDDIDYMNILNDLKSSLKIIENIFCYIKSEEVLDLNSKNELSGPELANYVESLYRDGKLGTRTICKSLIALISYKKKRRK